MYLTRSEYDRGVNTFSPAGRLFQVEYAMEAIKLGSTSLGIQTSEGVVLAAEKRLTSKLMEPRSLEKVVEVDHHIGAVMSGLTADARTLIDHARVEAQNYHFTYNEPIAVESITQSVCDIALRFGEDREGREDVMSRPYGVALLIGGIDERGPALFHTDPSGTFLQFYAKAIGSGYEGAQTQLEQSYHKSMTLKEAMILGATVLRQVMEEKLTPANIEVGIVEASTKKFRLLSGAEIEALVAELPAPELDTKL